MEKYYIIEEKELIDLLKSYYKLVALESGGVDNWEWSGASIGDFIDGYIRENNIVFNDEDDEWDFSIDTIVIKELENYEEVK